MKHTRPESPPPPSPRAAGVSLPGKFARLAAPLLMAAGLAAPVSLAAPLRLDFTTNGGADLGASGWTRVTEPAAEAGVTNVGGSGFNFQFFDIGSYSTGDTTQPLTTSGFYNSSDYVNGKTFTLSNLPPGKTVKLYASAAWNGNTAGGFILFGDNAPSGVKAQTVGSPGTAPTIANLTYIGAAVADGTGAVSGKLYGRTSVGGTGEGQVGSFIFLPTSTITATAGPNGSITPPGATDVVGNGSQSYTITANSGYHVSDVLVDGVSVGSVSSYTFTNVTDNHTITASFAADGVSHTITATAGANGSISPAGATSAFQGTSKLFTITPDTGYHIANVLVDGASVGPVGSYTFTNVQANHTISASFAIDTFTITATAGPNGTITPAGTSTVNYGSFNDYTITPAPGYYISHLIVDGVSVPVSENYMFDAVTANHTISAAFDNRTRLYLDFTSTEAPFAGVSGWNTIPANHLGDTMINVTDVGGSGYNFSIDHVGAYDNGNGNQPMTRSGFYTIGTPGAPHPFSVSGLIPGQVVTLYASAAWDGNASGSYVVYGNSGASGVKAQTIGDPGQNPSITNLTLIGTASADTTGKVTGSMYGNQANFTGQGQLGAFLFAIEAPPTWTINASAGANGTISPAGAVSVASGANQSFTITPNSGFHVTDVLVDGVSVGAVTSYTFSTVVANHTIAASFAANTVSHTITASAGPNGSITPSGSISAFQGTNQVFNITANTGYHIADVLVNGVSVGPVGTYTFTNVQANQTIAASFAIDTFTVTASAGANGSISPSGAVSVNYGASRTFDFTPASGYQVDEVIVDGISVGAPSSYTFENVTASHTISVSFDNRLNLRLDLTSGTPTCANWTRVLANFLANTEDAFIDDIAGTPYDFSVKNVGAWDNNDPTQPLTRSGFYTYGQNANDHGFTLGGLNPGQTVTMYACSAWNGNAQGAYIVFGDSGAAGVKAQTVGTPGNTPTFENFTLIGTATADESGTVTGSLHGQNGVNSASEGQVGGIIFSITPGGSAPSPFSTWASSAPYFLTGSDALPMADPDKDGVANLLEYALGGTSPIDGSGRGLVFRSMATVGGTPNVLTLTIAVRETASFSADGNLMRSAVVDGISYKVEGGSSLADWGSETVTEVTGTDATTIQSLLPLPESGWSYKTFRTAGSVAGDSRDFIRVGVE